jgi:hypothetical protein
LEFFWGFLDEVRVHLLRNILQWFL